MALITQDSGCKVGWAYYDDEDEARARGRVEDARREEMFARGYDFGYQWPGSIEKITHREHGECWKVVTT